MSSRRHSRPPPDECAQCGATIPRNALACPECGADERTGWRESSLYDGLDLPDAAWEENDDETGGSAASRNRPAVYRIGGIAWYWIAVGLVLAILMILGVLGGL
ncbi:hypothetical protein OpiT1DRAFT_01135 [Opitutaceae bacterium TAV1]|nr:hypothetical protein OpiT1DRAFT_01135 [Opitutaceae bacterium TAV1]